MLLWGQLVSFLKSYHSFRIFTNDITLWWLLFILWSSPMITGEFSTIQEQLAQHEEKLESFEQYEQDLRGQVLLTLLDMTFSYPVMYQPSMRWCWLTIMAQSTATQQLLQQHAEHIRAEVCSASADHSARVCCEYNHVWNRRNSWKRSFRRRCVTRPRRMRWNHSWCWA